jgi:hypothetical protein
MTDEHQLPSSMTRPLPEQGMPLTEEMEGLDDSLAFNLDRKAKAAKDA